MIGSDENNRLNALIEAYLHDEADDAQLRELSAWLSADPKAAERLTMTSMIQARFRAEADPSFVRETLAATNPRAKRDSGFVRQIMDQVRDDGCEEGTRMALPLRLTLPNYKPQAEAKPVRPKIKVPRDYTWVIGGVAALFMLYLFGRILFVSQDTVGRLTLAHPGARIERDGALISMDNTQVVNNGDILVSGNESMAFEYLSDATVIQLRPETRLRVIVEGKQKRLRLLTGRMEATVAPQPAGNPMLLNTSHAEVKVVGTRFVLHESTAATGLEVQEGKIRLTRQDGAALDVPAGNSVRAQEKDTQPMQLTKLAEVSEGLISRWTFDENLGQTANDRALGGEPAQIYGARWIDGRKGSALYFESGAYVGLNSSPQLNFPSGAAFSVTGWFKTKAEYGTLFSLRNRTDEGAVVAVAIGNNGGSNDRGKIMALIRPDGPLRPPYCQVIGGLANDDVWHHYALTRTSEGVLELFLDGIAQGNSRNAGSRGPITTNLRAFGNERYWSEMRGSTQGSFTGALDEIRVYDRVLSSTEIQQLAR